MSDDNLLEQEWEPVGWKKSPIPKGTSAKKETPLPFHRRLVHARQLAHMTQHKLTQALGIKLRDLESYENGKAIPEKNVLARINRILGTRLEIA